MIRHASGDHRGRVSRFGGGQAPDGDRVDVHDSMSAPGSNRGSPTCSAWTERTAPTEEDLFSAWRLFFERMAEEGPSLDAGLRRPPLGGRGLLDFVEALLEWSRAFRSSLTLARPDFLERHPGLGHGFHVVLELGSDRALGRTRSDGSRAGSAGLAAARGSANARRACRSHGRDRSLRSRLLSQDEEVTGSPAPVGSSRCRRPSRR